MRRTTIALAALVSLIAWCCPQIAVAGDDAVTEAVRALLAGANGETRARAEALVRENPGEAVRALLGVTAVRAETGAIVTLGEVPAPSAPAAAPADGEPVIQIYDVKDLVGGAVTAEELSERLRQLAGGEPTVKSTGRGQLVVHAVPAAHASMVDFLGRLRASEGRLYQIDARLIRAPMTATVGTQVMRARPGEVVELDDALARVGEWTRTGDVEIVGAPRISCLRGQTGSIQVGRQISYVADFDVEVAQSSFIADPVVGVVWDGVVAEFTAWSTTEDRIQLALDVTVSDVEEPLATFQTSLGALNEPVTVQVPSFVRTQLHRSLTVEDGGSVLVRLADGPDMRRLVLLTVTTLDLVESENDDGE